MRISIYCLLGLLLSINNTIAATIVDQDFMVEWNSFNQFNESPFAQTFTVGVTGQLDQVDLVLSQLDRTGNLIIEIQNILYGSPLVDNPTVLASVSMPLNRLPSSSANGTGPGLVNIDFSSENLSVTAGDQLAIVLRKDQGGLSGESGVVWFGSSDPDLYYTYGAGWRLQTGCYDIGILETTTSSTADCPSVWVKASTNDYAFKTYVTTVPLPPSFMLFLSGLIGMFLPKIRKLII